MTYVFVSFRPPPYLCPSDGHKHGVSIQSLINLRRTFLRISPTRNIAQTWIFVRLFEYSSSFIFLILDFICWMVFIMVCQWKPPIGDFNLNWLIQKDKTPLHNLFVRDHNYRQLVSCYTTDNRTTIDHIYTNWLESEVNVHILETYFTDHKAICAFIQTTWLCCKTNIS